MAYLEGYSRVVAFLGMLVLLGAATGRGQIRCNLHTSGCLDPDLIDGQTYRVPANVTRIEPDGIAVCGPTIGYQPLDLLFVVDQSGSMSLNDEAFTAPKVIRAAMDTLREKSPSSTAGYIGFANGNCDGTNPNQSIHGAGPRHATPPNTVVPPLPVGDPGQFAILVEQSAYDATNFHFDCGSRLTYGTNYYRAFLEAEAMLTDTALIRHDRQVILFITDGEPNAEGEVDAFIDWAQGVNTADFPAVIALFITDQSAGLAGRQALEDLALATGGSFRTVPTNDPRTLGEVMREVLLEAITLNIPLFTQINNLTNGQSASAGETDHEQQATGEYRATLDDAIGLEWALNQMQLISRTRDAPQTTAGFDIHVGPDSVGGPGTFQVANSPFSAVCGEATRLFITDTGFTPLQVLDFQSTRYGLSLHNTRAAGQAPVAVTVPGLGDGESIALDPVQSRGVGDFDGMAAAATPGNAVTEGVVDDSVRAVWQHPRDARDRAEAAVPIADLRRWDVNLAWIIDGNGDGAADSVFIEFQNPIPRLPFEISDISWPVEGGDARMGAFDPDDPAAGNIAFLDERTIVIDLSKGPSSGPFPTGATGPGVPYPELTLPDGTTTPILDRIGPVLVSATKYPSDFRRYLLRIGDSLAPRTFPDTLEFTVSEPLIPAQSGAPWKTMLEFIRDCDPGGPTVGLIVLFEPVTPDSLTWRAVFPAHVEAENLKAGDCVRFQEGAPYADVANNPPAGGRVSVTGRDGEAARLFSSIYVPVVTGEGPSQVLRSVSKIIETSLPTQSVPILDENGRPDGQMPYNTSSQLFRDHTPLKWIPPVGFTAQGTVNPACPAGPFTPIPTQGYEPGCLSAVIVFSEGPYVAEVNIYDHMGKFVHHSIQRFGYCGELNNPERQQPAGFVSFLVWNQKDPNGVDVKSGVYVWKVVYRYEGRRSQQSTYRQGIARGAGEFRLGACTPVYAEWAAAR